MGIIAHAPTDPTVDPRSSRVLEHTDTHCVGTSTGTDLM